MNSNYIVEYKNIRLRPLYEEDIEFLRQLRNDENISRYLTNIGIVSKEQQTLWYEKVKERKDEIVFAIEEIDNFKRCVGSCSLYDIKNDIAEFGKICVDPKTKGLKIGYNAIYAAMYIGFMKLSLKKIISKTFEENIAAKTVFNNLNFEIIRMQKNKEMNELVLDIKKETFEKMFLNDDVIRLEEI